MRNDSWNHLPIPPDLSRPREQTKLIRQDRGPRNQIVRDRPVATFTEQEVRTLHGVVSCLTESWRDTENQRRHRASEDS